ncbi:hypothetical protein NDU88_003364 [Pleurodeles waltl]|uniref:Secreted protein n=1 Tax=Pleurodeles waltl TaxID=8319 RepID=A0AAV7WSK5_PLEWA|nr:hypothetical protein NDU88_003364 [Pleurodeles waltl]
MLCAVGCACGRAAVLQYRGQRPMQSEAAWFLSAGCCFQTEQHGHEAMKEPRASLESARQMKVANSPAPAEKSSKFQGCNQTSSFRSHLSHFSRRSEL